MAASVREKGFAATTLADVVRHAGVSRRTFYEHFTDPVDCYLVLIEELGNAMLAAVAAQMATEGTLAERIDRAVGAYLDAFEADPALSRSYWTEASLLGERGRAVSHRLSHRTGDLLHELVEAARREDPSLLALTPQAGVLLGAGIRELALLQHDLGEPLAAVRATAAETLRRAIGLR
jgi:AcrR family transcriptional regulator